MIANLAKMRRIALRELNAPPGPHMQKLIDNLDKEIDHYASEEDGIALFCIRIGAAYWLDHKKEAYLAAKKRRQHLNMSAAQKKRREQER